MPEGDKSLDVLGVKPVAEALNTVAKGATEGAGAFLSRICLPAAEEFGLLLRDKVSAWRARNAVAIAQKAEWMHSALPNNDRRHAHPRVVGAVIEHGSWADEDAVQSMWAGLLASACTEDGSDQNNLLFINILSQLTPSEVRLLNHACEHAKKTRSQAGWIVVEEMLFVPLAQLMEISRQSDVHRLDLELDHLRELGVLRLDAGFNPNSTNANLTPSPLGLQLYVRCQGFVGSALEFFGLEE